MSAEKDNIHGPPAPEGQAGSTAATATESSGEANPDAPTSALGKWSDKFLSGVERLGNKLPTPFTLFLILFLFTAIASSIMAWMDVSVIVPGSDEELFIRGLFTGEGMTWLTVNL